MTELIVNNRIDAWKTDINLFCYSHKSSNCSLSIFVNVAEIINSCVCPLINNEISQWACKNFCRYCKIHMLMSQSTQRYLALCMPTHCTYFRPPTQKRCYHTYSAIATVGHVTYLSFTSSCVVCGFESLANATSSFRIETYNLCTEIWQTNFNILLLNLK